MGLPSLPCHCALRAARSTAYRVRLDLINAGGQSGPQLMFPKAQDADALALEFAGGAGVPLPVAGDLEAPEGVICAGQVTASSKILAPKAWHEWSNLHWHCWAHGGRMQKASGQNGEIDLARIRVFHHVAVGREAWRMEL